MHLFDWLKASLADLFGYRERRIANFDELRNIPPFPEGPLRPFLTDSDRPRYLSIDGEAH